MRTNAADVGVQFDGLYARKKNNDIARKPSHFELVLYLEVSSGEIIWLQKNVATIRTKAREKSTIEHTRNDTI